MNIQLPRHIDRSAFLSWVQSQEGRYELAEGRVIMMVGASRNHAIILTNLQALIRAQLNRREWAVVADFGLDTGPETLRYPDIMVDRKGGRGGDSTAIAPALLVEILSPTTATYDLGDKATEYLRLASLSAYVVFGQDEPKAWVWVRGDAGFPSGPEVVAGDGAAVHVAALGVDLPFSEVYADIEAT